MAWMLLFKCYMLMAVIVVIVVPFIVFPYCSIPWSPGCRVICPFFMLVFISRLGGVFVRVFVISFIYSV